VGRYTPTAFNNSRLAVGEADHRRGARQNGVWGSGVIITTNCIDLGSLHIGHYADAVRVPASDDHFDVSGMLGSRRTARCS
jgi:hypothetical protein